MVFPKLYWCAQLPPGTVEWGAFTFNGRVVFAYPSKMNETLFGLDILRPPSMLDSDIRELALASIRARQTTRIGMVFTNTHSSQELYKQV
jgi:hypothetical protein